MQAVFFPKETQNFTFDTAVKAVEQQRLARITKIAVYVIGVVGAGTLVVLAEAAMFTAIVAIPVGVVTLLAAGIFFYLNKHDQSYQANLSDEMRSDIAKHELVQLLCKKPPKTAGEIDKALGKLNVLFDWKVFNAPFAEQLRDLAKRGNSQSSLASQARDGSKPLVLAYDLTWKEAGHFMLPSYDHTLKISWDGKSESEIAVAYTKAVSTSENQEEE